MTAVVEIRTQADFSALYSSIEADFRGVRWAKWMEAEMRGLENFYQANWRGQRSPDGAPWAENRPSTIKRKKHQVILVGVRPKSGPRLRDAMTMPYADGAVRYAIDEWPRAVIVHGSDIPYSPINERDRWQGGTPIPARPHVGVSMPYFDAMAGRATNHAFEAIQK